jgi:DNA-binding transcriptional ArsR family regulator
MTLQQIEPSGGAPTPADVGGVPVAGPRPGPARDVFDALADGHRRAILGMLHEGDLSVNELAARLPISRPAVSRHLRLLSDAGLVAETHAGTRHIFRLQPQGARVVQEYLERVWGTDGTRPAPAGDHGDAGVAGGGGSDPRFAAVEQPESAP